MEEIRIFYEKYPMWSYTLTQRRMFFVVLFVIFHTLQANNKSPLTFSLSDTLYNNTHSHLDRLASQYHCHSEGKDL